MSLNKSIDLVLSYSASEAFILIWYDRYKEESVIEKTNEKLKIFHYLESKLANNENVTQLIKIITQDYINKKEKNTHPAMVFFYILEELKKANIQLAKVDFNEIENQNVVSYEMNDQIYEEMIQKVENNYIKTFVYQKRRETSQNFAEKGLSSYVAITGEVLTQLFAKEYIETYTNKKTLDIPQAYKKTNSGKNYIEQVNPKISKIENKTFIQKVKDMFNY